jgi:hypothetical protein
MDAVNKVLEMWEHEYLFAKQFIDYLKNFIKPKVLKNNDWLNNDE